MSRYLVKRLCQSLIILVLVSILTFFLTSMMPRDIVHALLGDDISQEDYDAAYVRLNLDKPIIYRYGLWAKDFLHGDFGVSYRYHMPVVKLIGQKIGVTLYLSALSTLISFPLGIYFGIVTAVKRGKWQDTVLTMLANLTASIPGFVIAIVLLYVFGLKLKLLPSTGFTFPWVNFTKHIRQLIMPLICLSIGGIAGVTRQTRSSMLEVIRQDYVRTARSKGLKYSYIVKKHIMRNGLIPIVTMIGDRLAFMIAGSAFVESVFSIPGMGSLMVQAVNDVDIPVMQACALISSAAICFAHLLTDFLYVAVDPRISLS